MLKNIYYIYNIHIYINIPHILVVVLPQGLCMCCALFLERSSFMFLRSFFPHLLQVCVQNHLLRDFPGGAVVKNLPANAEDIGSSPGPGRSHMPWSN